MANENYTISDRWSEVWFSHWPPEPQIGAGKEMKPEKWARLVPYLIMTLVFVAGISFLVPGEVWTIWILRDLGIALMTAAILGTTLDITVRRLWLKEVFGVAFGYLLAPEFHGQIDWIFNIKWLAIHHDQSIFVTQIDEDLVRVTSILHRTIKNITHKSQCIPPLGFEIEEWYHKKASSKITHFTVTYAKKRFSIEDGSFSVDTIAYGLQVKNPKLKIPSNETYDVAIESEEIKYCNDKIVDFYRAATKDPTVRIELPKGWDLDIQFVSPEQGETIDRGAGHHQFVGTLLPFQPIQIVWRRPSDIDRWLKGEQRDKTEIESKTPSTSETKREVEDGNKENKVQDGSKEASTNQEGI